MEFEGVKYFAHSRVSNTSDYTYKAYTGKHKIVLKQEKPVYKTSVINKINRVHDTEAKFLEYVRTLKSTKDKFEVTILSEKHICESCKGVVKQFKKEFPKAKVNIISGKKGYNGNSGGTKTWKYRKKVK